MRSVFVVQQTNDNKSTHAQGYCESTGRTEAPAPCCDNTRGLATKTFDIYAFPRVAHQKRARVLQITFRLIANSRMAPLNYREHCSASARPNGAHKITLAPSGAWRHGHSASLTSLLAALKMIILLRMHNQVNCTLVR